MHFWLRADGNIASMACGRVLLAIVLAGISEKDGAKKTYLTIRRGVWHGSIPILTHNAGKDYGSQKLWETTPNFPFFSRNCTVPVPFGEPLSRRQINTCCQFLGLFSNAKLQKYLQKSSSQLKKNHHHFPWKTWMSSFFFKMKKNSQNIFPVILFFCNFGLPWILCALHLGKPSLFWGWVPSPSGPLRLWCIVRLGRNERGAAFHPCQPFLPVPAVPHPMARVEMQNNGRPMPAGPRFPPLVSGGQSELDIAAWYP